jgi:thiol:disulfide interchange protein DsbD
LLERINEWQYALQQALERYLESGSLVAILVVFAAGLLTSFTPCVYPMIPVTVTFIGTASSGSRRRAITLSAVYALGLATLYSILGMVAALAGATFGDFTRNAWIYGAVALVLGLFAVAMMGWINIPVPGFAGKMQTSGVQKGGHFGAFFVGLAAGFVAAPCTAPVLGLLLTYVARTRDVLWGGVLLFFFAVGLSFLLMLLGIFSRMLANLPKPGRWMNAVKYLFSAGMLLAALYFLWVAIEIAIQG